MRLQLLSSHTLSQQHIQQLEKIYSELPSCRGDEYWLLATFNERIVAAAIAQQGEHLLSVRALSVHSATRRRGIGRFMLETLRTNHSQTLRLQVEDQSIELLAQACGGQRLDNTYVWHN